SVRPQNPCSPPLRLPHRTCSQAPSYSPGVSPQGPGRAGDEDREPGEDADDRPMIVTRTQRCARDLADSVRRGESGDGLQGVRPDLEWDEESADEREDSEDHAGDLDRVLRRQQVAEHDAEGREDPGGDDDERTGQQQGAQWGVDPGEAARTKTTMTDTAPRTIDTTTLVRM